MLRPALVLVFALAGLAAEPQRLLGPGRSYRPSTEQKSPIRIVGSTTLAGLAQAWGEGFRQFHPKVEVAVECKGSESAYPELTKEGIVIGAVSRSLSADELKALESKSGRKHVAIDVCEEGLAIIVHPENPLPGLSLKRLRRLLAMPSQEATAPRPATWGDAGLAGAWAELSVALHVRDGASGSRAYFKSTVLGPSWTERPATAHAKTADVMSAVAREKNALGYCRWLAVPKDVKVVPVFAKDEEVPASWSEAAALDPSHRLNRRLSLVVACDPAGKLPPQTLEFLLFVLGKEGQEELVKDGFTPLASSQLVEQFTKLGFDLEK